MKKMNVCFFLISSGWAGAENVVYHLAKYIQKQGHQVNIILNEETHPYFKELKDIKSHKGNIKTAKLVGELVAKRALEKGIKKIIFDRSGYLYHGSIKAVAESSREAGLEF